MWCRLSSLHENPAVPYAGAAGRRFAVSQTGARTAHPIAKPRSDDSDATAVGGPGLSDRVNRSREGCGWGYIDRADWKACTITSDAPRPPAQPVRRPRGPPPGPPASPDAG